MNNKPSFHITGASSLIVIFAVLCLCVFSLITLSTSLAEKRINDASVKAISDYYIADSKAEETISQIRSGNIPQNVYSDGDNYYFEVSVCENQRLEVILKKNTFEITSYSLKSQHSFEENQPNLWDGSNIFQEDVL